MSDVSKEKLVSVKQARDSIPNRPSLNTLYRWMYKGVNGGIKLESYQIGGRVYTSEEACKRFLAATNRSAHKDTSFRQKAIKQAQVLLDRSGVN